MAVAYTEKLPQIGKADFSGRRPNQKGIMDQMKSRREAADKLLSKVEGYDISKLIPPLRDHFKTYMNQEMEKIYDFSIDDPVAARQAVQNIANWFNTHAAHNSKEVQSSRELLNEVATDPAAASKYNDQLPVYQQSAATPQGSIMAQQMFEGNDITTYMGADGTVFFKQVDQETGEEVGDWVPIQSWERWSNPSTFAAPTTSRYGKSAIQIGETVVRGSVESYDDKVWNRPAAIKSATGIVNSGSDNEDGAAARAWAVQNLWGDGYRDNEALVSAYITSDINSPEYNLHEDYINNKNKNLINEMVEASRFPNREDDDDGGAGRGRQVFKNEFDSKSEYEFNTSQLFKEGQLLAFDEMGRVMNLEDMDESEMKGTRYTLGSLAKNTKETDAIKLPNPNFGQEHRALAELNRRYADIENKNSESAKNIRDKIYFLEEDLGEGKLEPEQFDLNLSDLVFLPNGKLALMNLNYKGSKVKTIMLDEINDKPKVDQIIQAIRRVYNDETITFEKLQKGLVTGPKGDVEKVVQDVTSSANQPKAGDSLFE